MDPRPELNAYIEEVRDRPFRWGEHDCLTFTNEAWRRMHGHGWADDWLGRYMRDGQPIKRGEMRREYGAATLEQAIDGRLTRVLHVPPVGALVTTTQARRWVTGAAMGICTGTKGVFLGDFGVVFVPLTDIENGWTA